MNKILIGILLAIISILAFPFMAFASIPSPDIEYSIIQVEAYQNVIEDDDQLYVIQYEIEYSAIPIEGTSDELFLCRLMNGTTQLGVTTPYPANANGYSRGLMSIYFGADDVTSLGLVWESASYSVQLIGNPVLDWTDGDPPSTTNSSFSNWTSFSSASDVNTTLSLRLSVIAQIIETAWAGISDLIEGTGGDRTLTDEGAEYFTLAIPNLRLMAPSLFSEALIVSDFGDTPLISNRYVSGADSGSVCQSVNWLAQTFTPQRDYPIDRIELMGVKTCLLYTSPSPRDRQRSRMPSSA